MKSFYKKMLSFALCMLLLFCCTFSVAGAAQTDDPLSDGYTFTKISNPQNGSGQADGLNTDDLTNYDANRYNSYAWAMVTRGDSIYIGTNRNLFGAALYSVANSMQLDQKAREKLFSLFTLISDGDLPNYLAMNSDECIPQIIKINAKTGQSEVIYRPNLQERGLDPRTEIASFRSVVEYQGDLYFGSLGMHTTQVVKIDAQDDATVVYEASAVGSSLRACAVYQDVLYFGGQDTTLKSWTQEAQAAGCKPIVIRSMNPQNDSDWSTIVADYRDFGEYSKSTVYNAAGGTVWDLIEYAGSLYLTLATDYGFALFAGQPDALSPAANEYGWVWTEIVGDNGAYPLGMDESVREQNADYPGLVASTATPYVYNGKLYIGTFDNATLNTSGIATKIFARLNYISKGDLKSGPSLSEIYGSLYTSLNCPQKLYVMDENQTITPVEQANALLENTNNEYIWRFQEYQGNLYMGTFDASSDYKYFVTLPGSTLLGVENTQDNAYTQQIDSILSGFPGDATSAVKGSPQNALQEFRDVLVGFLNDQVELESFVSSAQQTLDCCDVSNLKGASGDVLAQLQQLKNAIDIKGLLMLVELNRKITNAEAGFDMLVASPEGDWEAVTRDGMGDPYNYGARTFAVCEDQLYVGTANPFYGAQLWRVTWEPGSVTADLVPGAYYGWEYVELTSTNADATIYYTLDGNTPDQNSTPYTQPILVDRGTVIRAVSICKGQLGEVAEFAYTVAPLLIGDVNGDKAITSADALLALRIALNDYPPLEVQRTAADANGDGVVTTADALLILQWSLVSESMR